MAEMKENAKVVYYNATKGKNNGVQFVLRPKKEHY